MIYVDAFKLVDAITDRAKRKAIKGRLDYYSKAHWAGSDLHLARETIKLIVRREEAQGYGPLSPDDVLIDAGLGARAFLLYAEATSKFDPSKALNDEQKRRHEDLRNIRRKAVAHREHFEHPSGSWLESHTVFELEGFEANLRWYSDRANYLGSALLDMVTLIDVIEPWIMAKASEKEDEIYAELEDAWQRGLLERGPGLIARVQREAPPMSSERTAREHLVIDGLVDRSS
ncbi:hypothetical protein [Sphingomonas sp. BK580]|uniref:hypothetical protein n=1 Tax=Sphingomonas sp. BK580 TaxID=2586972 RepID=UPI001608DDAC|nr:hypothetical protein [Sphingomonas sp. BK580]MBB3691436.1 hypothetical protein [Sphingomonas sp. BK580]